ncbi:unnamed protein product [Bursaphelenchus okinawaensis]|uniref:PLAT domain-containing protein n=1 Tax=Bursaphelenchus okinawaensis TaxID=465554 RepID=A0A811KAD0_9BILA|nr:unnamed protein product [Bursaphelenchus okinawaensis]CAG9098894.1 unnamed protein product [Bursaphelenchus okinawaensis]
MSDNVDGGGNPSLDPNASAAPSEVPIGSVVPNSDPSDQAVPAGAQNGSAVPALDQSAPAALSEAQNGPVAASVDSNAPAAPPSDTSAQEAPIESQNGSVAPPADSNGLEVPPPDQNAQTTPSVPVPPSNLAVQTAQERSQSNSRSEREIVLSLRARSRSSFSDRGENTSYSIVVRTSKQPNAGTNANVFVQLTDEDGLQTDKLRLKCSITHRKKFSRGHSDLFLLVDQIQLGNLKHVDVWHHKRGVGGTWLLHSINVIEHTNHRLFHFPCLKQLGDKNGLSRMDYVRLEVKGKPIQVLHSTDFSVDQ